MDTNPSFRDLPAVEAVLRHPAIQGALDSGELPRSLAADVVRDVLDGLRARLRAELPLTFAELELDWVADVCLTRARDKNLPKLRRVINATGVVLHTNLGRACLGQGAVDAMVRAAGYCNLEYDLETGARGKREGLVEELICELTGAEAAVVVNNNAAAVFLSLAALARGREVVVSRGELVEIGGAFRIPEVMAQSGALLREVGTTNKTRPEDYEAAITPETGMLLKVHTSNYKVCGFTQEATLSELVGLGGKHGLPVVYDLGSGLLWDREPVGGEREPTVPEVVAQGAHLVTFSGDKLLGGPQAGIVAGRAQAVARCRKNPIMRAMRPDKVTLAALEATLKLYRDPERAAREIPALRMLLLGEGELERRAERLAGLFCERIEGVDIEVRAESSEAGGGSLPMAEFPTRVVAVSLPSGGLSHVEARLRAGNPPVIARVKEDALLFDPRTLDEEEEPLVAEALENALKEIL